MKKFILLLLVLSILPSVYSYPDAFCYILNSGTKCINSTSDFNQDGNNYVSQFGIWRSGITVTWSLNRTGMTTMTGTWTDLDTDTDTDTDTRWGLNTSDLINQSNSIGLNHTLLNVLYGGASVGDGTGGWTNTTTQTATTLTTMINNYLRVNATIYIGDILNIPAVENLIIHSNVSDSTRRTAAFAILDDSTYQVGMFLQENNSGSAGEYIRFATGGGVQRIAIDQNGQLGVGRLDPAYRLDVNGSANVSSTLYVPVISLNGTVRDSWPTGGTSDGTGGWTNDSLRTNTSLLVVIGGGGPGSGDNDIAVLGADKVGEVYIGSNASNVGGRIYITEGSSSAFTSASGGGLEYDGVTNELYLSIAGSQSLALDANRIITIQRDTKNVGINNTNPMYALDIKGSANVSNILHTPQICLAGDCKTAWPTDGVSDGTGGWTNNSINTTTTLRVLVPSISIGGIPSILYMFDANNIPSARFFNTSNGGHMFFGINTNYIKYLSSEFGFGTQQSNGIRFYVNTDSDNVSDMIITDGGDVGIGLIAPTQKLDVNGSINISGDIYLNGLEMYGDTNTPSIQLSQTNGARLRYSTAGVIVGSSSVRVETSTGAETWRATATGLGINIQTPGAKLHVNASMIVNGTINTTEICLAGDCRTAWPTGSAPGAGSINNESLNTTNVGTLGQVLTLGANSQFTWANDAVGAGGSSDTAWFNTSNYVTTSKFVNITNSVNISGDVIIDSATNRKLVVDGTINSTGNIYSGNRLYQRNVTVRDHNSYFCDFVAAQGTTMCQPYYFGAALSTGGASAVYSGNDTVPGAVSLSAGTGANSGYVYRTDPLAFLINGSEYFSARLAFMNSRRNETWARIGFCDSTAIGTECVDAIAYNITNLTVSPMVAANSVRKSAGSVFTLTNQTWYYFTIKVNNNVTDANFTIYNSTYSVVYSANISGPGSLFPATQGRQTGSEVIYGTRQANSAALIGIIIDYINTEIVRDIRII